MKTEFVRFCISLSLPLLNVLLLFVVARIEDLVVEALFAETLFTDLNIDFPSFVLLTLNFEAKPNIFAPAPPASKLIIASWSEVSFAMFATRDATRPPVEKP